MRSSNSLEEKERICVLPLFLIPRVHLYDMPGVLLVHGIITLFTTRINFSFRGLFWINQRRIFSLSLWVPTLIPYHYTPGQRYDNENKNSIFLNRIWYFVTVVVWLRQWVSVVSSTMWGCLTCWLAHDLKRPTMLPKKTLCLWTVNASWTCRQVPPSLHLNPDPRLSPVFCSRIWIMMV